MGRNLPKKVMLRAPNCLRPALTIIIITADGLILHGLVYIVMTTTVIIIIINISINYYCRHLAYKSL